MERKTKERKERRMKNECDIIEAKKDKSELEGL